MILAIRLIFGVTKEQTTVSFSLLKYIISTVFNPDTSRKSKRILFLLYIQAQQESMKFSTILKQPRGCLKLAPISSSNE